MSKKCPWCKVDVYLTEIKHWWRCPECQTEFPERAFPKESTLFDRITQSSEVLAKEFVEPYTRWVEGGHLETLWRSNFRELSGMLFDTKEEALAATSEKLKEVKK